MSININALDGLTLPEGCEHCQAEQKIDANWGGRGIHRIAVYHDDWCPQINGGNRATRRAATRRKCSISLGAAAYQASPCLDGLFPASKYCKHNHFRRS